MVPTPREIEQRQAPAREAIERLCDDLMELRVQLQEAAERQEAQAALIREMAAQLREARSNYIAGEPEDERWDRKRDELCARAEAMAAPEGG